MSVVPQKFVERIQFFEDHIAPWTTNALAIGTTTGEVTALQTKTQTARTAFDAQQAAQNAAKAATEAFRQAIDAMTNAGNAIIEQVRTKSRSAGPGVYPLAEIPAPATPTPVGNPGKPSNLVVTMSDLGTLELTWKCVNPPGCTNVVYQIWRRTEGADDAYLGGTGAKQFTDTTVPPGATSLVYSIQAVRSTGVGPWASFIVKFGTAGGPTVAMTKPRMVA